MTLDDFDKALDEECRKLVFEKMVLKLICDKESITISDKEYADGLAKYAADNGFSTPKECEDYYGEDAVRQSLIWDKALLYLVDKAELTDVTTAVK